MIKNTIKRILRKVIRSVPEKIKGFLFQEIQNERILAEESRKKFEPPVDIKVGKLIQQAVSAANSGSFHLAEKKLQEAAMMDPGDPRIPPHIGRVRFLQSRSRNDGAGLEIEKMHEILAAMNKEIESRPIYVPSEFWGTFGKFHVQTLERYGIENFKRTVSHNYQNWPMYSMNDLQVKKLFKTWTTHFSLVPWENTIEWLDHIGHHESLSFDDPFYFMAKPENREVYRLAVGLLWEFVRNNDSFGLLDQLTELEVGNPVKIWRQGKLISSDLAHSVRERNMLLDSQALKGNEKLTVGELGAGHGRLAEIFGRTTNYRYYIFDITPALFVSQWYIKAIFPNEKIFEFRHFDDFSRIREELEECRFAFFTANQIEKLPADSLNFFINMNSLMEMRKDQIENFLRHIDRLTKGLFLSRQYIRWTNFLENTTVTKETFRLPSRWHLMLDKVDDIHPAFFNQIWKRS